MIDLKVGDKIRNTLGSILKVEDLRPGEVKIKSPFKTSWVPRRAVDSYLRNGWLLLTQQQHRQHIPHWSLRADSPDKIPTGYEVVPTSEQIGSRCPDGVIYWSPYGDDGAGWYSKWVSPRSRFVVESPPIWNPGLVYVRPIKEQRSRDADQPSAVEKVKGIGVSRIMYEPQVDDMWEP